MRKRIAIAAGLAFVCAVLVGSAAAVSFDTPARLANRQVDLTWQPEADDPLFTGNLEIFFEGQTDVGNVEIAHLLFDLYGQVLWAISRNGELVAKLVPSGGTWAVDTLLVGLNGGSVQVTSAALHPAGHLLVAGLANGSIAVWRPGVGQGVSIFAGHDTTGACRGVAFAPDAVAADSSFVTVGDDGMLMEWLRPGELRRSMPVSSGPLTAVSAAREGRDVAAAVGHADGQLTVWLLGAEAVRLLRLDAHPGSAINRIIFSVDGSRIASADEQGNVRVWDATDGTLFGTHVPDAPGDVFIAFSPRESAYIAYATRAGEIGVLDGAVGARYNVYRQLGRTITAFALAPDGLIGYFGGATGKVEWWHQGKCVPSADTPDCFGGYIVWRGATTDQFGDSTWQWTARDSLRAFVDPDSVIPRSGDPEGEVAGPHNGVPYFYSLTTYRRIFLNGQEHVVFANSPEAQYKGLYRDEPGGEPAPLIPRVEAVSEKPLLGRVFVVPDPYMEDQASSQFDPNGLGHIRFFNLPSAATVRIYTTSGERVRTLQHPQGSGGKAGGSLLWNLKNEDGHDVVSGVYFYAVETSAGESKTGYFTIVR
jgi:WD40 repeat protein